MSMVEELPNLIADCIAVSPGHIRVRVHKLDEFVIEGERLAVGSYLRVSDHDDCAIIAVVSSFTIEAPPPGKGGEDDISGEPKYIIDATPIGYINHKNEFQRGGHKIAIPPTKVELARKNDLASIFSTMNDGTPFCFSRLASDEEIKLPLDGDKFFNKHIAIVGSTGSGKSHTVSSILQTAIKEGVLEGTAINNSHIVLFDIHGEYRTAFPSARYLDVSTLSLPYWIMNDEELEELFIESGEQQSYNQRSVLRRVVTLNKEIHSGNPLVQFGTPVYFSVTEIINCLGNLSKETVLYQDKDKVAIKAGHQAFPTDRDKLTKYFETSLEFEPPKNQNFNKGTYADGTLDKFITRITNKVNDKRLSFIFSDNSSSGTADVLSTLMGYGSTSPSNIVVIDLSGVPFEALSITVSVITRLIFDFAYYYKRLVTDTEAKVPFLLVYEEAHKYVPKTQSASFNACRTAVERVAKEGRKYGVSMAIVTQRPSELSETIFSQCNNCVVMRLTNPDDQNYVRRLVPDSLGPILEAIPTLEQGEAIILGDSIIMPAICKIDRCNPAPSSSDVKFLREWKRPWTDARLEELLKTWLKESEKQQQPAA